MELKKRIEDIEVRIYSARIRLGKEQGKPRPDPVVVAKQEGEIKRLSEELELLRQKEGAGIRYICEKCSHEWSIPAKKCPRCGHADKGFVGNLLARFGL